MFSVAFILLLVLPPTGEPLQSPAISPSSVAAAVSAASSFDVEQSGWGQPLLQQIAGDVHSSEEEAISLSVNSCCAGNVRPMYLALAEPATKPANATPIANPATLAGTIRAEGQPIPADIVVYLEPKDASAKFPVPAQRARVAQKGAQFSPRLTVVSVGQTVEFVNDEDRAVEHNVFSNSPTAAFDLGLFPQRQSRTVVFDKPGPVVLYCSIHKFMDGVVLVCPTPMFSRVDANGKYKIENVVPGEYTLKMWQRRPRHPDQSAAVSAKAGQNVQLDLELHRK